MTTEYNHGGAISNIWSPNGGRSWSWSNAAGEGCGEPTFETAVTAAEKAITTHKLEAVRKTLQIHACDMAEHLIVCDFSEEDSTPSLHIDLWKGYDLGDLNESVNQLAIASEGHWAGGRSYSLQVK